jgi:3-methyladenine DNA glycosylase Mpg
METDIFKHIKIIIYEAYVCKNDKATHFYHRK